MSRVTITVSLQDNAEKLINHAEDILMSTLLSAATYLQTLMKVPGAPSTSPVNWDGVKDPRMHTTKQQRAYFATGGFGRGVPTQRSGSVESGIVVNSMTGGYMVQSVVPHFVYVHGDENGEGQSNIHKGRWSLLSDALAQVIQWLRDNLDDAVYKINREQD